MKPLFRIEDLFRTMCNNSPSPVYFFEKYIVFKHVLYDEFYSKVPEVIPGYTDHTHNHIDGVLFQVDRLLAEKIDPKYTNERDYISLYELYLLLMSVIFHDVALLVEDRENHSDLTRIISIFDSIILTESEKEWISNIVKCHQSHVRIEEEIQFTEKLIDNYEVRPKFVAAMVRLADELDERKKRANDIAFCLQIQTEASTIFHKFSKCVDGIRPNSKNGTIDIEISIQKDDLYSIYKKGEEDKLFIEEVICRVDKINSERQYCMQFSAYYVEYKSVDLKIFIKDGAKVLSTIQYSFDERRKLVDFWDSSRAAIERFKP